MAVVEEKERNANYKPVLVTEITDELHFYVQDVETGKSLESFSIVSLPFFSHRCNAMRQSVNFLLCHHFLTMPFYRHINSIHPVLGWVQNSLNSLS